MLIYPNESDSNIDGWRKRFLLNNPKYGQPLLELCDSSFEKVEINIHYNYISVGNLAFISDTLYDIHDIGIHLYNRFEKLRISDSPSCSDITVDEYPSLIRMLSEDSSHVTYQGYEQFDAFKLDPYYCLLVNEGDDKVKNIISKSIVHSAMTGLTLAKKDIIVDDRSYHVLVDTISIIDDNRISVVPNRSGINRTIRTLIPQLAAEWSFSSNSSPVVPNLNHVIYIVNGSRIVDFLPLETPEADVTKEYFITSHISISDKELLTHDEVVAALSDHLDAYPDPTEINVRYISKQQYLTVQIIILIILIVTIILKKNKYERN